MKLVSSHIYSWFYGDGSESIELMDSNGKFIDVSNKQHHYEVKLTNQELIDENIGIIGWRWSLKDVVKDDGSPGCRNRL